VEYVLPLAHQAPTTTAKYWNITIENQSERSLIQINYKPDILLRRLKVLEGFTYSDGEFQIFDPNLKSPLRSKAQQAVQGTS